MDPNYLTRERMIEEMNPEGLTFHEWTCAVVVPTPGMDGGFARDQWRRGVDPTEWRAAFENFTMPYVGMETPWGPAQSVVGILSGLWSVSTASHGGVYLSPARQERMPLPLATRGPIHGIPNQWYEEDDDALRIVLAFKEEFISSGKMTADQVSSASDHFQSRYPNTFKLWRDL